MENMNTKDAGKVVTINGVKATVQGTRRIAGAHGEVVQVIAKDANGNLVIDVQRLWDVG